ncbi:hypothetical protein AUJ46_05480 [Candidatus Peregrinibacteria bacterium CG1_02_54_53]|nr:MAG: hypothetical protein AUJ46_05480 [Candidatus Peregrinibacteria bacterium CG1_02_54_53]
MTDIHPNWQATDNASEEQSLPVRVVEKPKPANQIPTQTVLQPRVRRLSRQPAAIAGMLLAVSIGLSFFFGIDRGAATTVRITQEGFTPKAISVTPGNSIQWINETDRTHVLQSDAPCSGDRQCFSMVSVAPGETASLSVTDDFIAGTYLYYSISAQGMEASITVLAGTSESTPTAVRPSLEQNLAKAAPFAGVQKSSSFSQNAATTSSVSSRAVAMAFALATEGDDDFIDITSILTENDSASQFGDQVQNDGSRDSLPFGGTTAGTKSSPGAPITQLPVNPYTVNATRTHPFDSEGKSVANASSAISLHGGAPRPLAQPSTGPALWVTIFGTFGLLFFVSRRALQKPYI